MTDSVRGPDGSDSSEGLCGTVPKRDAWRGGGSYEASMLRDLLAVIHRDGGHYVEAHGLDKAIEDARAAVLAAHGALAELVALKGMKDVLERPSIAWLDSGKLPEIRRAYEQRKEPAWQAAREALARGDAMPPPKPHVKTPAELRMDAAHDTSCVGAFARARPGA